MSGQSEPKRGDTPACCEEARGSIAIEWTSCLGEDEAAGWGVLAGRYDGGDNRREVARFCPFCGAKLGTGPGDPITKTESPAEAFALGLHAGGERASTAAQEVAPRTVNDTSSGWVRTEDRSVWETAPLRWVAELQVVPPLWRARVEATKTGAVVETFGDRHETRAAAEFACVAAASDLYAKLRDESAP